MHVTVPARLLFSKCFHTDDELADDSSIAKTGYFSDLGLFSSCASGTNNSNNEAKFEHRWTNTFIRIFDLFVSPLLQSHVHVFWAALSLFFFFFASQWGCLKSLHVDSGHNIFHLGKTPPSQLDQDEEGSHTYISALWSAPDSAFFFFVIVDQVDGYISKQKTELMITNFYAVLKFLKRRKKSHFLEDNEVESSSIRSASVKDMSSFRLKKKSRRSKQYSVW